MAHNNPVKLERHAQLLNDIAALLGKISVFLLRIFSGMFLEVCADAPPCHLLV